MASTSLSELLTTLKSSIETASESLCEPEQLRPPHNGISLLDTKNELFLSYLQSLVFLIILKLRHARSELSQEPGDDQATSRTQLRDDVVGKLVELRVYLEKGVKPLENRLRYQIDKVVRTADDAALKTAMKNANIKSPKSKPKANGLKQSKSGSDSASAPDDEEEEDEEDEDDTDNEEEIDPLSYRPNPAAFTSSNERTVAGSQPDGIYRPPRITATTMPGTTTTSSRRGKPQRSATLDEFVATELSSAPIAEPSIGTTIRAGGRRSINAKEREEQRERARYEESHFVRLPTESKAERKKKNKGRPRDGGWGGEDWRDIGQGADRIVGALDKKTDREPGSRVRAALEKSRKRVREGPSGESGVKMGEAFERRKKAEERKKKRRRN